MIGILKLCGNSKWERNNTDQRHNIKSLRSHVRTCFLSARVFSHSYDGIEPLYSTLEDWEALQRDAPPMPLRLFGILETADVNNGFSHSHFFTYFNGQKIYLILCEDLDLCSQQSESLMRGFILICDRTLILSVGLIRAIDPSHKEGYFRDIYAWNSPGFDTNELLNHENLILWLFNEADTVFEQITA